MDRVQQLNVALADRLGDVLTPPWRESLLCTPRHRFLPDRGWRLTDGSDKRIEIDRSVDPDAWLEAAYSDDIIITHTPADDDGPSSCSMPFMVMTMLGYLNVQLGEKVLEIGTGTGWTAALLANYLRDERSVATVEVDPKVAAAARGNLGRLGLGNIDMAVADGALGYPSSAPFNRIIATCTVREVPHAWVEQTCPGGAILTPWGTPLDNGALLRLTVDDSGVAQGKFVATSTFMWLRAHQFNAPDEPDDFAQRAARSTIDVEKTHLLDSAAMFTAGLLVPDCKMSFDYYDNGDIETVWLLAADSWASVGSNGDVGQLGQRSLWNEVAAAHQTWEDAGSPDHNRFGVTVTHGRQSVWLDTASNVIVTLECGSP